MSRKMRNTFRPATMRNFSNYILERYILIDDASTTEAQKDQLVKDINERLWLAIQETNMLIEGRILPFVVVRRVIVDNTKLRIIINDFDSNKAVNQYDEIREIDIHKLTHLINFKLLSPQRRIMVSDDIIPGNAKMIIDHKEQISAAVDIFLDIAMFNSYSFLREMELREKQAFSKVKLDFFLYNRNILDREFYYFLDKNKPPKYFSFAFAARVDYNRFDFRKYIDLWNKFIEYKYNGFCNVNITPVEQIEFYKDKENIDKKYFDSSFWGNYSGDYLLLRLNRKPNKYEHRIQLFNYFGITEMHEGATKLVPTVQYFDAFLKKQIDELYISAFKVVCTQ